jgi:hypothetical protein
MAQSAFGTRIGFVTLSQQFFSCLFLGILVDALQRLNSHFCTSRKNTSKPVNCLQTTTIIFYLSLTFPSGFVFFRITPKATCTTRLLPWTASSSSTHSQRQNLGTPYPVRTSCNNKARGVITGALGETTARESRHCCGVAGVTAAMQCKRNLTIIWTREADRRFSKTSPCTRYHLTPTPSHQMLRIYPHVAQI